MEGRTRRLYSIGHSNHSLEAFLSLLTANSIDVLVDCRSHPYSRYAPQFNAEMLSRALSEIGINYLFMGSELGGRPQQEEYYDEEGHVLYSGLSRAPLFLQGIERLEKGLDSYRVALMCSEEDPAVCHRYLLVGRVLAGRGVQTQHIRGNGQLQTDEELERQIGGAKDDGQLSLFEEPKEPAWRSLRSVLPRKRQASSSKR
jgi:uncharacterized protein (DUF488 family)